jgi:hypothetical protein
MDQPIPVKSQSGGVPVEVTFCVILAGNFINIFSVGKLVRDHLRYIKQMSIRVSGDNWDGLGFGGRHSFPHCTVQPDHCARSDVEMQAAKQKKVWCMMDGRTFRLLWR